MICPRCKTNLENGARFCGACGAKLLASGELAEPELPGAKTLVSAEPVFPPSGPASPRGGPSHTTVPAPGGAPARGGPPPAAPVRQAPAPAPVRQAPAPAPAVVRPAPAAPARIAPPASSPRDPFLGKTLNNRYLIEAKLGEGGFGSVYRGKQVAIGREVALKLLRPEMARDPNIVARFRREGAVACNLRDAHTITTYDFDQTPEGIMYIAMELLKGRSLHDIFHDEAPIPWQRVFNILEQMCSSLNEAHQAGIVHRDLKPENVYLENRPGHTDYVKILDFGIAKIVSGEIGGGSQSPQLTQTGQTLGTLEYMSPEQLMGKQLDGRSDIYALGVVAYELLTGQLPFPDAKGPAELIAAQLKKTPPPPSSVRAEMRVPPGVDAVIARMLEKSRDKRFADVAQLRDSVANVTASGGQLPPFASQSMPAMAQVPAAAPAAFRPAAPVPQMGPQMGPPPAAPPLAMPSVQPLGPPPMSLPPQGMHMRPPSQPGLSPAGAPLRQRRVPSTQEAIAAAKGGGNVWIWIIIAAFLLGGGAAGVYFAFIR